MYVVCDFLRFRLELLETLKAQEYAKAQAVSDTEETSEISEPILDSSQSQSSKQEAANTIRTSIPKDIVGDEEKQR